MVKRREGIALSILELRKTFSDGRSLGCLGVEQVTSNKNVKVGGKENNLRDSRGGDTGC